MAIQTPPFSLATRPASCRLRAARLTGLCLLAGLLGACAHQPMMYSWDSYQPAVYAYLQGGEDPATQTQIMEKNIETARARNAALPPGFHAHLGLLYLQQGQGARAMEQIQSEKAAFPESASFMDFLLRRAKEPAKGGATPPAGGKDSSANASAPEPSDPPHAKQSS